MLLITKRSFSFLCYSFCCCCCSYFMDTACLCFRWGYYSGFIFYVCSFLLLPALSLFSLNSFSFVHLIFLSLEVLFKCLIITGYPSTFKNEALKSELEALWDGWLLTSWVSLSGSKEGIRPFYWGTPYGTIWRSSLWIRQFLQRRILWSPALGISTWLSTSWELSCGMWVGEGGSEVSSLFGS